MGHKQELEFSPLEMLVVHHVGVLPVNQDLVVPQSLTASGDHTVDGVHVHKHVESEHKQNLELASLVMLVEKHVKDVQQ
jgi:hypothetical protein